MSKLVLIFVFIVFFMGLVCAQITQINYYVYENKVLVENYFNSVSNLELRVPYDSKNIEVNSNYTLEDLGNYKLIKISYGQNISVEYITESMIDNSRKGDYFTSINYLNGTQKVKLVLPESYVLSKEGILFPKPDFISSDGRSIVLNWENYNEDQIIVKYESLGGNNILFYLLLIFVVFLFFIYLIFRKVKLKKISKKINQKKNPQRKENIQKKKELLTANLLEDEKRIVEFLVGRKNNEAWTKEILRGIGISKVKLSRKIRSLEKKELVKKIPYGNENRIKLVKK